MILYAVALAFGGEMYVGSGLSAPGTFDGRELVSVPQHFLTPPEFVQHESLVFDRGIGALYSCFYWSDGVHPDEARFLLWGRDGLSLGMGLCPYILLGVSVNSPYFDPSTNAIQDSGQYYPREWVDPPGMAVGWNGVGLEGIRADGTVVPLGSATIFAHLSIFTAVAWDGDTQLIWAFGYGNAGQRALALDPSDAHVVAEVYSDRLVGPNFATGYYDTHPEQTPELLVTGQCPGTVYVTLVDGTPGGRAYVAAGTVAGPSVLPAGACGDVELGLGDPVRRATLPINRFGIASTTFQATPDQCGARLLQALDLRTCAPTQVRTVPPTLP